MKVLAFVSINSGATLNKTLQATGQLYTYYKSENVYINYGDGSTQTISVSSGRMFNILTNITFILKSNSFKVGLSNFTVPNTLTNPVSSSSSTFLLLNSEFYSPAILTGFQLYGATSGVITIQVLNMFILIPKL